VVSGSQKIPVGEFEIQLPLNKLTETDFEQAIWASLRAAMYGSTPVSTQEIINFITGHKLAVIIKTSLLTEDLKSVPLKSIGLIFQFWDQWPELSEHLLLFIVLSFKYQRKQGKLRVFQNLSRSRINKRIRQYLNQLKFSGYENIHGVVLPELAAISQGDAEALIRREEVNKYYDIEDHDIRSLYDARALRNSDGCIPMEMLLDHLHRRIRTEIKT
jgi:hypothetical protein